MRGAPAGGNPGTLARRGTGRGSGRRAAVGLGLGPGPCPPGRKASVQIEVLPMQPGHPPSLAPSRTNPPARLRVLKGRVLQLRHRAYSALDRPLDLRPTARGTSLPVPVRALGATQSRRDCDSPALLGVRPSVAWREGQARALEGPQDNAEKLAKGPTLILTAPRLSPNELAA